MLLNRSLSNSASVIVRKYEGVPSTRVEVEKQASSKNRGWMLCSKTSGKALLLRNAALYHSFPVCQSSLSRLLKQWSCCLAASSSSRVSTKRSYSPLYSSRTGPQERGKCGAEGAEPLNECSQISLAMSTTSAVDAGYSVADRWVIHLAKVFSSRSDDIWR